MNVKRVDNKSQHSDININSLSDPPLQTETSNSLTCAICIDVITDLDEWLTSDKTEQEIIDFVEQVNH